MEAVESEKNLDVSKNVYSRGYPLYRLTKKECSPSMNLLKTFNVKAPKHNDFLKDPRKLEWSQSITNAFLVILKDVELFAMKNEFNNCQKTALYEIFYSCFHLFTMLPALHKERFFEYFRETLLLYTVQDPPERLRIFNGTEAFAVARLFHELLGVNFELMKYVLMPVYIISISVK